MFLFGLAGLVVVGLIGWVVVQSKAPSPYDGFAQCLTDKGVTMYGAWWCPHCKNQKDLFGSAFKKVAYVECATNPANQNAMDQACVDVGIKGYPTWTFPDGTQLSGEQSLQSLAEKSGCSLP